MKLSDDSITDGYFIRSYTPGRITVASLNLPPEGDSKDEMPTTQLNEEVLENSFILSANEIVRDWEPNTTSELSEQDAEKLISLQPDIIILGTGASLRFPDPAWSAIFLERRIGLEVMDTAAACRTYAILCADDRNVIAALMLNQA